MRCTIDGCDRRHHGRGMCQGHYRRWANGSPVDGPIGSAGPRSPLDDDTINADLREFVARGRSDTWIGRELGYSSRTILRWRKELGLQRPACSPLPVFTLPAGLSLVSPFTSNNESPSVRVVGREK